MIVRLKLRRILDTSLFNSQVTLFLQKKIVRFTLLIYSFVLSLTFTARGQLINNTLGKSFEEQPYFNAKEIKLKKVKEIRTTNFQKKTGDIMRDLEKQSVYYFNEKGYLATVFEIQNSGLGPDTSYFQYIYSPKGMLKTLRKNSYLGFTSTNYSYDSIGQVIKEEYFRDKVVQRDLTDPLFKQDSILDFETVRYKSYPNQKKKIVYNSYGNPYIDYITYTNSKGQIIEIAKKLKMTSEINEVKYYYNPNNLVDSIVKFSSLNPKETESIHFKYDSKNNLMSKKSYVNKKLIAQTEFLYNAQTGVLSSIIKQEVATNLLSITRFETIYYD